MRITLTENELKLLKALKMGLTELQEKQITKFKRDLYIYEVENKYLPDEIEDMVIGYMPEEEYTLALFFRFKKEEDLDMGLAQSILYLIHGLYELDEPEAHITIWDILELLEPDTDPISYNFNYGINFHGYPKENDHIISRMMVEAEIKESEDLSYSWAILSLTDSAS